MSTDVAKTIAFFETLSKSMDKVRTYLRPRIPSSFTEIPKTKPDALSVEYNIEFLDKRFSVARTCVRVIGCRDKRLRVVNG